MGGPGVDTTAYQAALDVLASGRYPFADLPREVVDMDGLDHLIPTMAGETEEVPSVHGVFVPGSSQFAGSADTRASRRYVPMTAKVRRGRFG